MAVFFAPLAYAASPFGGDAQICKSMVFGESFRVIQADKEKEDDCKKLYVLHAQFREIATDYNQAVKEMHLHFSERKTMALLNRMEGITKEMSAIARLVIALVRDTCPVQEFAFLPVHVRISCSQVLASLFDAAAARGSKRNK